MCTLLNKKQYIEKRLIFKNDSAMKNHMKFAFWLNCEKCGIPERYNMVTDDTTDNIHIAASSVNMWYSGLFMLLSYIQLAMNEIIVNKTDGWDDVDELTEQDMHECDDLVAVIGAKRKRQVIAPKHIDSQQDCNHDCDDDDNNDDNDPDNDDNNDPDNDDDNDPDNNDDDDTNDTENNNDDNDDNNHITATQQPSDQYHEQRQSKKHRTESTYHHPIISPMDR